jgi:Tfp pilus assembly PilM family ATPase
MSRWSLSLTDVPAPAAAIEIAATHVSAATLTTRGARSIVTAAAIEALPAGAVVPSLTSSNLKDGAAVRAALQRVLEKVGRPRRAGLVVPDPVAKVSLIRFQQIPARAQELDQLIRFQLKKAAPFALDEAQISYVPGYRAPDGIDYLVSLARTDVVREYESCCDDLGVQTGIVDIQTFNVVNAGLVLGRRPLADWLLVNVAPDWASVVVGRGDDMILYRSRTADAEGTLVDLVHQTSMYYEDRLSGTGFERVLMHGTTTGTAQASDFDRLRAELSERLGTAVDVVDPRALVEINETATASRSAELSALVGLLLRDKQVAA